VTGDDLIKSTVTIKMQVVNSSLKVHSKDQSHKAQVMVTMQMSYKDVVDAMKISLQTHELHLRSFATIDKKGAILYFD
jgi:hypothetical protein